MAEIVRWGIIGTGAIAKKFATALKHLPDAKLVAVASRSQVTADEFGRALDVEQRHASYDALVNDRQVDAVYVATPHSAHKENALAALAANKPVLVEKPFTINAREAAQVIDFARQRQLLVMEAMWTRFLPLYVRLRELLAQQVIGDVRLLTAEFGFKAGPTANRRLFDPALGGGALLDLGVYPVSVASMLFGTPTELAGVASLGTTGVDEQCAATLRYPQGQIAVIGCSLQADTAMEISLRGSAGSIRIHAPAWKSTAFTLRRHGGKEEIVQCPFEGNGYQFEAIEFMNCLRENKLESATIPLAETLSIMGTLDRLRAQWGLRYPSEMPAA